MATMKLQATLRYAAPAEAVSAMLVDPEFHHLIGQQIQATACSTVPGPDTITVTYRLPTGEALRLLPGTEQELTGRLTWTTPLLDGRRQGQLILTVERFPAQLSAKLALSAGADLTEVSYDADFKVNIPLVGGKLEKKAGGAAQQILEAGQAIGQRWLSEHGY
jgi:hypothetical protein